MMFDLCNLQSYTFARKKMQAKPELAPQIVEAFLQHINDKSNLNAFVEVYAEEARTQAKIAEERFASGRARKLEGMVVGIKDLFCYKNHAVTAGSDILKGFVSQITSTAVQRLFDQGAIIIGTQNCDAFGMGSANENSVYGPVHHPIDPERSSGGSSGGSAVAVKALMCHASLGTDTGGSVRQPASFSGILGMKPTYSRISRYGVIAYASSFDVVGVLTHTVEDMGLILAHIAGEDGKDNTSSSMPVPNYHQMLDKPLGAGMKIAYLEEPLAHQEVSEEVKKAFLNTLDRLEEAGYEIQPVSFPLLDYVLPAYYTLTTAEASANLSRYDGMRYGYRAEGYKNLHDMVTHTRTQGFGKEVKRRIFLGNFVLSASHYEACYTKAQRVRRKIKDYLTDILSSYSFILCPTTPTTAFLKGSTHKNPIAQYLADLFSVPFSAAGLPVLSIPIGEGVHGLPIGMQIAAGPFQEGPILQLAAHLKKADLCG